jgi:urease accessory protein
MTRPALTIFALTLALALAAGPALAHVDPATHGSFAAGFTHPVFGWDHILAMVAVGLWAAMLAGRAVWALPGAFVGAMLAGFGLALAGAPLPLVEPMILASVVALGLLVALAVRMPLGGSLALVAAFGLFHGHAHGGELGGAGALGFGAGFVLATALLHGFGVALALALTRGLAGARGQQVLRALGALAAATGVWLAAG